MAEVKLACRCGMVKGLATRVTPQSGTRLVCYCDDCQAFANFLKEGENIVDEYGGTDIFQLAPSQVNITKGIDQVRCIKLRPKGLFRWYTECCQTPIGNTLSPGVPFIGVIHSFMDDDGSRDDNLGPVIGHVQTKFSSQPMPGHIKQTKFPLGIMIRSLVKVLGWKIKGLGQPSVLFHHDGSPISNPRILNIES